MPYNRSAVFGIVKVVCLIFVFKLCVSTVGSGIGWAEVAAAPQQNYRRDIQRVRLGTYGLVKTIQRLS